MKRALHKFFHYESESAVGWMLLDWPKQLARDGPEVTLCGLQIAMHCHHYNLNLQKMLEDQLGEEGVRMLVQAVEEATFCGFRSVLMQYEHLKTPKSKLELASALSRNSGVGVIHFQDVGPEGGHIVSSSSHHVTGWLAKYGRRDSPGCHFFRGWIAGVLEVVYDRPFGYYEVREERCKMMLDEVCSFQVKEK